MPRIRSIAILALAAGIAACTASPEPPRPKLLLVGIDGVRPDVLAEVETPNLDALAAQGFFTARARTGTPTVSGPGWSSMLTGVWPAKHGVHSNDFSGSRYDLYPDFLTRLEAVHPEARTVVLADWLPLVTEDSGGPLVGEAPDAKHALDGYEVGWGMADSILTAMAVEELRTGDPDALFLYLGNPDEASHHSGSIGSEYRDAVAEADRRVGEVVAAVRSRPGYAGEDWLVLVSTDHGRRPDGGHGGDSEEETVIFFLASGASTARDGLGEDVRIVDVAATALAHLGVTLDPSWELDGRPVGLRSR